MPYRNYSREQDWLLPPSLGELLPADHPVRFVAEFVDGLDLKELGISDIAAVEGAPRFAPRLLLALWIYGFMVRVRASRQLEVHCRENIAFMWLAGLQHPDHVTLARFYQTNRQVVRSLLKETVQLAMRAGLVDFALQAVDGSRVAISGQDRLKGRAALEKLLAKVEAEIAAMEEAEAASAASGSPRPVRVRAKRAKLAVRERVQRALRVVVRKQEANEKVRRRASAVPPAGPSATQPAGGASAETAVPREAENGEPTAGGTGATLPNTASLAEAQAAQAGEPSSTATSDVASPLTPTGESAAPASGRVSKPNAEPNKTTKPTRIKVHREPGASVADPEAVLVKSRHGWRTGYNGQVAVDSKAQIVVAADVIAMSADANQLQPMVAEAREMTGRAAAALVADAGYFAMPDLIAVETQGIAVYVPDGRSARGDAPEKNPYHKAHFVYDPDNDTFSCPLGQNLVFHCEYRTKAGKTGRQYRCASCQGCPAHDNGACTKARQGRSIVLFGHELPLRTHAAKIQTEAAKEILHRRGSIVEPVFAFLREQMGLRRFLLRGLTNVTAEWRLLCAAHNLRKLWKLWWRPKTLKAMLAA